MNWIENRLIDSEEIAIIRYQLCLLAYEQRWVNEELQRLKVRYGHHTNYCEKPYIEEEHEVININYNFQLIKFLNEFLKLHQGSFGGFEVECGNLVTKASECEKLVEMRIKRHVIWVEEEILKPKKNGIRRVNHDDLYVTLESQLMELEEKDHLPKKHQPSSRLESTHSMSLFVGAWGHLILYAKFMEFLPNKRKKKDDVFFLSFMPP
ncbi:hypothetical protein QL285_062522 [Trifolium repens]|jgi:hypothetical protein|nr:hypothetical protein QL285_062522 [Trifolium repens]